MTKQPRPITHNRSIQYSTSRRIPSSRPTPARRRWWPPTDTGRQPSAGPYATEPRPRRPRRPDRPAAQRRVRDRPTPGGAGEPGQPTAPTGSTLRSGSTRQTESRTASNDHRARRMAGTARRPALRRDERAFRRSEPGGDDRLAEGGRSLRPGVRGALRDLCHADHPRRAAAALPGSHMGCARAARRQGAQDPDQCRDRRRDRRTRSFADGR